MTTMLFYERLAPLDRERHAALKFRTDGVGFARATNSIPVLLAEMAPAARSYPLLFTAMGQDQMFPVALTGLSESRNLFVDADGDWSAHCYVPAFVRRYPFVLSDDMTVLVDEAYPGLNDKDGAALFDEGGGNSPMLDHTIAFLREFQDQVALTQAFVATLRAHDLLKPVALTITDADAAAVTMEGLLIVDVAKLAALDDAAVAALFRSGALAAIHAHVASLDGLDDLKQRHFAAHAADHPPTAADAPDATLVAADEGQES